MNAKVALTVEMILLWIGTLLVYKKKHPNVSWVDTYVFVGLPSGVAVAALFALLTIPIDVSGAEWPAIFGAIITGSAILYEGQGIATSIDHVLEVLQGIEATPLTSGAPPTN